MKTSATAFPELAELAELADSPDMADRAGNGLAPVENSAQFKRGSAQIRLKAAGREWFFARPADLEALWEGMTEEKFLADERLPYWVEIWPASIALSDWLLTQRHALQGQPCLDLGCGLGLTALVGQSLGAKVLAMDYEPEALEYAQYNAWLNKVPQPLWFVADWRAPAIKAGAFSFIWGGDIMYERRFVEPVLNFLEYALAPGDNGRGGNDRGNNDRGGRAWLAEPNRNVYAFFEEQLEARGWTSECVYSAKVEPLHVQKSLVSVSIREVRRK